MGVYQLRKEQFVKTDMDTLWDFVSSPKNLQEITPDYMGFNILTNPLPDKMYPGMIIKYKVSPLLGIKMTWVTEITHVSDRHYFVDEQRAGPYRIWHHEHFLEEKDGGILMTDIVTYQPPMGIFGAIANKVFIEKQLESIFEYRKIAIDQKFGV